MNEHRLSDSELIALCLAGVEAAWDALIRRHSSMIYTAAIRMGLSESDAQDVLQEVCLLLYDHLADLRDASRLPGWLIAITRRTVWRVRRQRKPRLMTEVEENRSLETASPIAGAAPEPPEDALLALEEQQLVRVGMERLAEPCRQLLTLLYCQDPPCSYAEAARRLNLSLGTISPQRIRCLKRLKEILQEIGF